MPRFLTFDYDCGLSILQEKHSLSLGFNAEGIHGGSLVSVRGSDFVVFYDWDGRVVRRVDVAAKSVHWSESGSSVAILGDSSFYILKYNRWVPYPCTHCLAEQQA